jgi:hypothetical protein
VGLAVRPIDDSPVAGVGLERALGGDAQKALTALTGHRKGEVVVRDAADSGPFGMFDQGLPSSEELVEQFSLDVIDRLAVDDGEMSAAPGDLLGLLDEQNLEVVAALVSVPVQSEPGVVRADLVKEVAEGVVGVLHRDAPVSPSLHETATRRYAVEP